MPLVAAISYELQRLSARYCTQGPLRFVLYPGFLFQQITTREPDDAQLEVAIAAMEMARAREQESLPGAAAADDRVHVFADFAGMSRAIAEMSLPRAAE